MCKLVFNDGDSKERMIVDPDNQQSVVNYLIAGVNNHEITKATRFETVIGGKNYTRPMYANPSRVYYEFKTQDKKSLKIYLDSTEYGENNLEGKLSHLVRETIKVKRAANLKKFAVGMAFVGTIVGLTAGILYADMKEYESYKEEMHAYVKDFNEENGSTLVDNVTIEPLDNVSKNHR